VTRRRLGRDVTTPKPRDVPAYPHAHAKGLTPHVPGTPPPVTVHPTAHLAFRDVVIGCVAVVVAVVTVAVAGGTDEQLTWGALGLMLSITTVGILALAILIRRWGRAQLAELQRGYTTHTFTMGKFWIGSPEGPITQGWVQWDWSATWVLTPTGLVQSPPHPDGDPPGLYPSPHTQGQLELWSGYQWSGYLLAPETAPD
jgi:hypothetical protein